MKVQLQGQTLRLRVDEHELAVLLAGETVANLTRFGSGGGWSQAIRLHEGLAARLASSADTLQVGLPRQAVLALQASLPSRDGLAFQVGQGDDSLEIRFDVDVRDSVRQRGVAKAMPQVASQV